MFACIHGPGAAASGCAYEFSPRVEELDANTVIVDAAGLDRLFGAPDDLAAILGRRFADLGFTGSIAIAANPGFCTSRRSVLKFMPPFYENRGLNVPGGLCIHISAAQTIEFSGMEDESV